MRRVLPVLALLACLAAAAPARAAVSDPFAGTGMWIWQLARSEHGDAGALAARARAAGVNTLIIKGANATQRWPQFSAELVRTLHAQGLSVCAYHFLYGRRPVAEAAVSASIVAAGADCLVVDVEGQYAGRYRAAQTYLARLRAAVGPDYPLGFTSLPYVSWHSTIPYSVFLGPGGAQVNLPQVYWKAIGGSVDRVFARTVSENAVYGRPLAPIGQLYSRPPVGSIARFRALAAAVGARGVSFWSWQSAAPSGWAALRRPVAPAALARAPAPIVLRRGARGDQVAWLQQHLAVRITSRFDTATETALRAFQLGRGLVPSGQTDAATWQAVLAGEPPAVRWTARGARLLRRAA
ncbi:MAG TPA: peptidoglycan-binding domain-containing protein [Solirubrobacteraceae bacterium]